MAADVWLYGTIGDGWDDDALTARRLVDELADAGGDVTVHVNSGGGDVFEAVAMHAALRAHGGRVTASVEGLAASSASMLLTAADEVVVAPGSMLMVHDPWACAQGGAGELRAMAERLDKVRDQFATLYAAKTGSGTEEMAALMAAETWMGAEEAVERGFADRVDSAARVAAMAVAPRCLGAYAHAPAGVRAGRCEPPRTMGGSDATGPEATAGEAPGGRAGAARGSLAVVAGRVRTMTRS